jgi:hypothetical protein
MLPTIFIADRFAYRDIGLLVRVLANQRLGELDSQAISHQFGQLRMAVTREKLYRVGRHLQGVLRRLGTGATW